MALKRVTSVLVVDGYTPLRDVIVAFFRQAGFRVDDVATVQHAVTLCENRDYDVVVTDFNCAGGGAVWLVEQLRRELNLTKLSIIIFSSEHEQLLRSYLKAAERQELRVDALVLKPDFAELVKAARELSQTTIENRPSATRHQGSQRR